MAPGAHIFAAPGSTFLPTGTRLLLQAKGVDVPVVRHQVHLAI